jgi:hypothetical protein
LEDFIIKNQTVEHNVDEPPCGDATFSYHFNRDKKQLIVKRGVIVGGKAETYTRNLNQLPSYHRTSP